MLISKCETPVFFFAEIVYRYTHQKEMESMHYENVTTGIFRSRKNRFIAEIELDGEVVLCHVKNTGIVYTRSKSGSSGKWQSES